MTGASATRYIEQVPRREIVHHEWGDTKDIITVLMAVVNKDHLKSQVRRFAKEFKGHDADSQYRQLKELHRFCRRNIRYMKDPDGLQDIMHPARTWSERRGDCKSLTVFIFFVCRALGVPCFIRFASYEKSKNIGHVYPVAILDGRAVPVDAVFEHFDGEEKATYVKDYFPAISDLEEMRAISRESRKAAIGGITRFAVPRWVRVTLGGLFVYQAFQSKGVPRILLAGSGALMLVDAFNKNQT
jgi:transglutaminase-like putative cysteine protease